MATALTAASSVVAVKIAKCVHMEAKNVMSCFNDNTVLNDVYTTYHPRPPDWLKECVLTIKCGKDIESPESWFEVDGSVTVGGIIHGFGMKVLHFACSKKENSLLDLVKQSAEVATTKTVDAFQLMMTKGRDYPEKRKASARVKSGLTRKDELYNQLVDDFRNRKVDFPKWLASTDGSYFIQVLCNVLWYITNQHTVIQDAALRKKDVLPIPDCYHDYSGYNDMKRKKMKEAPLNATTLRSHSQSIYSILMKPYVGSSTQWEQEKENIKGLAKCLDAYADYLDAQNSTMKRNQAFHHPVRTIDEHATIQHRKKAIYGVKRQYKLLDDVIRSTDEMKPVLFDEMDHLEKTFETSQQRWTYFDNIQLSSPIDMIKFSPGGSIVTSVCIVKVKPNRTEPEILIEGARLFQKVKPYLKEFHTRQQKVQFRERLKNVTHVLPSVADMIYKELTYDAAAAAHPVTVERLRLIFLGQTDLVTDMRHLNPGRPAGTFDMFFQHLEDVVNEVTAADDRRHNIAHLSEWLSLKELVAKAKERCPVDSPVPSKSLVRLQFAPLNPYTHAALKFKSKIMVQYKIQRRQLRASHPDEHYCAAQFRYFREKAVELGGKASVFFCDDKSKVPLGEPGCPVSTGVRGKKTLAPVHTILAAKDHDMNIASLTPSVYLNCDVPKTADKSFVRGVVTTITNDSVFQMSNPFRHAVAMIKILENQNEKPKIMMKFTDGGTDQRNTLEAVKCASICLFLELNFDMLVLARCAPGQSWINPAERVMSVLNLGLQNCSMERSRCEEETEKGIRKCGSMANIRTYSEKHPEIKENWTESIEHRFLRLSLKEKPMQALDPIPLADIDLLKRHLREHFPDLDLEKLQKVHTKKSKSYLSWVEKHCRQRNYSFQIRKCDNTNCCPQTTLSKEDLEWLPDPQDDNSNPGHYMLYSDVKGKDTVENYPSMKPQKVKEMCTKRVQQDKSRKKTPQMEETEPHQNMNEDDFIQEDLEYTEEKFGDAKLCTAQHARTTVECIECRKPRVVYSKHILTDRQNMSLVMILSDVEYSCGAPLTPPHHILNVTTMTRANLFCATPIEIPYYTAEKGRLDLCCHCGDEGAEVSLDLKKQYKTVLPMCEDCAHKGLQTVVARPFGKKQ